MQTRTTVISSVLAAALFLQPAPASADQCAALTDAQVRLTLSVIRVGDQVVKFCEPCGATVPGVPFKVEKVEATTTYGSPAVAVNGKAEDLAYLYLAQADGTYANVASLIGCPTSGVSTTLGGSGSSGQTQAASRTPMEHGRIATAILRSRRSEAATNLDAIRTAQLMYRAEFGSFLEVPACPSTRPGKDPRPFDSSCVGMWRVLGWEPEGEVRCTYMVSDVTAETFTLYAECDLDEDGVPSVWRATREKRAWLVTPDDAY